MKNKALLVTLFGLMMLTGCGQSGSSTNQQSSNQVVSYDSLTTEEVDTGIRYGDALIDIAVDKWLCVGQSYSISFSFTGLNDQTATVKSSHSDVISVTQDQYGNYFLNSLREGDTILTIYDFEGILHYRHVVKARPKIEENKILPWLVSVDHFKGWGMNGQSQLTFLSETQCQLSGYDGYTPLSPITFTFELNNDEYQQNDEYAFLITEFENTSSDMICTRFYVDFTGCMLHLCTNNVTVDVYTPVM